LSNGHHIQIKGFILVSCWRDLF